MGILGFGLHGTCKALVEVMLCLADFFCMSQKVIAAQVVGQLFKGIRAHIIFPIVETGSHQRQGERDGILLAVAHKGLV